MSGLTIWHVDNVVGTFYAHNSLEYPSEGEIFDLHQIVLRNPNSNFYYSKSHGSNASVVKEQYINQADSSSTTSGWDVVRSLSRSSSYYISTPHFERIWWDKCCDPRRPISIWRPLPRPGFSALGDCVTEGLDIDLLPFSF